MDIDIIYTILAQIASMFTISDYLTKIKKTKNHFRSEIWEYTAYHDSSNFSFKGQMFLEHNKKTGDLTIPNAMEWGERNSNNSIKERSGYWKSTDILVKNKRIYILFTFTEIKEKDTEMRDGIMILNIIKRGKIEGRYHFFKSDHSGFFKGKKEFKKIIKEL